MTDNQTNNTNSDEIDLGQLFQLIGRGFNKLFNFILKLFLYFKKNALILLILIVVGAAIGFGLSQIITKKLKTEVIVKPQMESKNYLYDVINEVQSNIRAKNLDFFRSIGIEMDNLDGLKVEIAPIDDGKVSSESEMKFLELLQSFENTDAVTDIVRAELQNKSSFNHRITFFYKNAENGKIFAQKVMEYINSNDYFGGLIEIYRENAQTRITENKALLKQVDELISNYSKQMAQKGVLSGSERIVLDNQERINITGLFTLKNNLIKDIEAKKIELKQRTEAIKLLNFGRSQEVQKSVFGKTIVLIPLTLLAGFFIASVLIFLNKKSKEI
ncbi:hypothetical protein [Croceitalea rosinachiae]|uniref:Chain length determinant protein n=1 Tax=Croceitalea rosinachiae TaxID=3075596 RepID=A0ABU3A7U4_9FLAO|nr:hypothetical protein [Croceitalea sp. F388]MDT0606251.1 hypothetical protein [Croceitalea sp. F388]